MRAFVTACVLLSTCFMYSATAQVDIYGFFQNQFKYATYSDETIFSEYGGISNPNDDRTTFAMQQLNVMMRTQLNDDFSSFINIEMTNSFSTEKSIGQLNLEEAWVMYKMDRALWIKGGMLIPTFNQMNTQKNKTPLLPWTIRPLVYETSLNSAINSEPLLPLTAFFEASGALSIGGDADFEYAVHLGNSGNVYKGDYDPETPSITRPDGPDSTSYMEFGGRLGITAGDLKIGVSGTMDHQPIYGWEYESPAVSTDATFSLGNVQRMRIGADLSYSIAGFSFLGEFILATYSLDADQEAALEEYYQANIIPGNSEWASNDLDRMTYFASLAYDIDEQWYVAGMYSFFQNKSSFATKEGITGLSFDIGYRPIDQVVIRASYARFEVLEVPTWPFGNYEGQWFMLTGSVVY